MLLTSSTTHSPTFSILLVSIRLLMTEFAFSIVQMYNDFFFLLLRGGICPLCAAYSSTKKSNSSAKPLIPRTYKGNDHCHHYLENQKIAKLTRMSLSFRISWPSGPVTSNFRWPDQNVRGQEQKIINCDSLKQHPWFRFWNIY